MIVTFPREITPVSAQGGTVEGQTVSFPAVAKLAPKQAVTYTIKAKGANPGDARTKFTLTSAELKAPVIAEESTTVY
ncbi:Large cysteine-rich periplasmic protein omcB [bioreactor metagenome]|uniref:Large cysteine-rich periplasmic protein omcB n=1 Tax=bioreactor metagenome TaxID=1076179 RepID=A0A645IP72_9ZZZZ